MPRAFVECTKSRGSKTRTIHPIPGKPQFYQHICWRSNGARKKKTYAGEIKRRRKVAKKKKAR